MSKLNKKEMRIVGRVQELKDKADRYVGLGKAIGSDDKTSIRAGVATLLDDLGVKPQSTCMAIADETFNIINSGIDLVGEYKDQPTPTLMSLACMGLMKWEDDTYDKEYAEKLAYLMG